MCRVSDFGLSRVVEKIIYQQQEKTGCPLRWTPMEAVFNGMYSQKSDVWSWAVMVWEIATSCQFPYTALWEDNDVTDMVDAGLRLHQPPSMTDAMYTLLAQCWHEAVDARPTFGQVLERMKKVEVPLLAKANKHAQQGFKFLGRAAAAKHLGGVPAGPGQGQGRSKGKGKGGSPLKRKGSLRGFDEGDEGGGEGGEGGENVYIQYWQASRPQYVPVTAPKCKRALLYRRCQHEEETPSFVPLTSGAADLVDHDDKLYQKTQEPGKIVVVPLRDGDLIPKQIPLVHHMAPDQAQADRFDDMERLVAKMRAASRVRGVRHTAPRRVFKRAGSGGW